MKHELSALRTFARSVHSPHGLMLIVCVSLFFNAPLAEAQTTPDEREPRIGVGVSTSARGERT